MKYSKHTVSIGDFVSIRQNDLIGYEVLEICDNVLVIREPIGDGSYHEKSVGHGHMHNNLSLMYRLVDGLMNI